MTICITNNEDISILLEKLHELRPQTEALLEELKCDVSSGRIQSMAKYYVDSWPDFNCILGLPFAYYDKETDYRIDYYLNFYAKDGQHLEDAITSCKKIPWHKKFLFCSSQMDLFDSLSNIIASRCNKKVSKEDAVQLNFFYALKDNIPQYSGPDNLAITSVKLDDVAQILEEWQYADLRDDSKQLIEWAIKNGPSLAIRNRHGSLIAYELCYPNGCLGLLHVHPYYRGTGLAKFLTTEMARKLVASGMDPRVSVEIDNEESKILHRKCGFIQSDNVTFLQQYPPVSKE